jgi:UDP-N-acetylmuramyl pentapeptide phosphotransferase/UDP-N-acetylglucosamine-1-phosphate transferase
MSYATVIVLAGVAFALSAWLTQRFLRPTSFFHVLDHPGSRSLHEQPVPRSGGVAMLSGFFAAVALVFLIGTISATAQWICGAALVLGVVSFVEDRHGLARRYRLAAHGLAAAALLPAGLAPEYVVVAGAGMSLGFATAAALLLLGTVWMINLYNFMDGMDGFAGGMAIIGFGALAVAGWTQGEPEFGLLAALVASSAAGFLLFNFPSPKARIFLGDAGSTVLGFLAAAFCLWAEAAGVLPLWAGLLVFSPFIVDASVTLGRRLAHGERIWEPHRSHYYQRLVRLGWGHRKTVVRAYGLMLVCAAAGLKGARMPPQDQIWLIAMCAALYVLIAYKVRHLERIAGRPQ